MEDQDVKQISKESMPKWGVRLTVSLLLLGFGLLSLFLTISVVFDLFGIREQEGNYVPFVVYANLVCGFFYVIGSYLNWIKNKWSTYLLSVSVVILIGTYSALLVYIENGGVYEEKTVNAMIFRIAVTIVLTVITYILNRNSGRIDSISNK